MANNKIEEAIEAPQEETPEIHPIPEATTQLLLKHLLASEYTQAMIITFLEARGLPVEKFELTGRFGVIVR